MCNPQGDWCETFKLERHLETSAGLEETCGNEERKFVLRRPAAWHLRTAARRKISARRHGGARVRGSSAGAPMSRARATCCKKRRRSVVPTKDLRTCRLPRIVQVYFFKAAPPKSGSVRDARRCLLCPLRRSSRTSPLRDAES